MWPSALIEQTQNSRTNLSLGLILPLPGLPGGLLLSAALNLQQGSVLMLVPLASLVAGKDRLSVQTPTGDHS